LGAASGGLALTNGTLAVLEDVSSDRAVSLAESDTVSTGSADSVALTGTIAGPGSLTLSGGGAVSLTGTNTYSGGTSVIRGTTVRVISDASLGATTADLILGDIGSACSLVALDNVSSGRGIVVNAGGA